MDEVPIHQIQHLRLSFIVYKKIPGSTCHTPDLLWRRGIVGGFPVVCGMKAYRYSTQMSMRPHDGLLTAGINRYERVLLLYASRHGEGDLMPLRCQRRYWW